MSNVAIYIGEKRGHIVVELNGEIVRKGYKCKLTFYHLHNNGDYSDTVCTLFQSPPVSSLSTGFHTILLFEPPSAPR